MTDKCSNLSENPRAFQARSVSVPVNVKFAQEDGEMQTLEGPVRYKAGDAIITGVKGEQWPVERERFMATYSPVQGTWMGEDGVYTKNPRVVWAVELDEPVRIELSRGFLQGQKGDFIVEYSPGDQAVVASDVFRKIYEPIDLHAAKPGENEVVKSRQVFRL